MATPTVRTPYMVIHRPAFDRLVVLLLPELLSPMVSIKDGGVLIGPMVMMACQKCLVILTDSLPDSEIGVIFAFEDSSMQEAPDAVYSKITDLVSAERMLANFNPRGDA
jgi:hypothetical protein